MEKIGLKYNLPFSLEPLAWVYDRCCKNCQLWKAWPASAKASELGLWADSHPFPMGLGKDKS